jgi:hypothetical protein
MKRTMPTRANLTEIADKEMRKVLASLTAAERRTLKDPDFITEDEEDLIISARALEKGKFYPLEQVIKENGLTPRRYRFGKGQ